MDNNETFETILKIFCVLGIVGNCWICAVVARRKTMQTSINLLLVSIAMAETLIALVLVMQSPFFAHAGDYFKSNATCRVIMFYDLLSNGFVSLIIAVPLLIKSFYERISSRNCLMLILCVLAFDSTLVAIPAYFAEFIHGVVHGTEKDICSIKLGDDDYFGKLPFHSYGTFSFIIIIFPIVCTASNLILHKIRKLTFLNGISSTNLMLLVMAVIHILCWSPRLILNQLMIYEKIEIESYEKYFKRTRVLLLIVPVYKPILWTIFDDGFNGEFRKQVSPFFNRNKTNDLELRQQV